MANHVTELCRRRHTVFPDVATVRAVIALRYTSSGTEKYFDRKIQERER
jgi:hypothetical protein